MAKHDAGTPSSDDSADEVANQFSSSKSRSKNKVASKSQSPSKSNATRKARKADETTVTSDDEEIPKGKTSGEDDDDDEAGEEEEYEIEKILEVEVGAIEEVCARHLRFFMSALPQSFVLLIILRASVPVSHRMWFVWYKNPDEICYYVHWKGYSAADDSWTTEDNAACVFHLIKNSDVLLTRSTRRHSGAQDLIKSFWKVQKRAGKPSRQDLLDVHEAKKARKAKKRKSLGTPAAKKPRASQGIDASSEDLGDMASKKSPTKRRRSSKPIVMDIDDETPARDEDEDRRLSKKRKSATDVGHANGRSASKKKSGGKDVAPQPHPLGVQGDLIEDTMTRYGKLKSWDDLVRAITTVERREEDNVLQIFWTRFVLCTPTRGPWFSLYHMQR